MTTIEAMSQLLFSGDYAVQLRRHQLSLHFKSPEQFNTRPNYFSKTQKCMQCKFLCDLVITR